MAIQIRIHPLDFQPDVAIGLDLPIMQSSGAGFKLNYTTLDQAVANAKNLLLTNKGERIMQPDFGCDLRNTLFENITDSLTLTIESVIKASFDYWLPYIFINDIQVTQYQDQNQITINLTISLEGNKFDTRSIQLDITNNQ
jgi:uncharacterized protein